MITNYNFILIICILLSGAIAFAQDAAETLRTFSVDESTVIAINRYKLLVETIDGKLKKKSGDERVFRLYEHYCEHYGHDIVTGTTGDLPGNEKIRYYYEAAIKNQKNSQAAPAYAYLGIEPPNSPLSEDLSKLVDIAVSPKNLYILNQSSMFVMEFEVSDSLIDSKNKNFYSINLLLIPQPLALSKVSFPKLIYYPNGILMLMIPYKDRDATKDAQNKIRMLQRVGSKFEIIGTVGITGTIEKKAQISTDKE